MNKSSRILYLDMIRIIACIQVVMIHVSAQSAYHIYTSRASYAIAGFCNSISFSGVALFVMISGAIFLSPTRETDLKKIVIHGTVHTYIIYYIWKAIYQSIEMIDIQEAFNYINIKNEIILASVQKRGAYHLWFLPMIAVMYLIVPLIKKGVSDKKNCMFFLAFFIVAGILAPTAFLFEFRFKYLFQDFFSINDFSIFSGYLGYFILGHYLHNWRDSFSRIHKIVIGVLGGGGSMVMCYIFGSRLSTPFSVSSFLIAVSIFFSMQAIEKRLEYSKFAVSFLNKGAVSTLGVYLMHPFFISLVYDGRYGEVLRSCPLVAIPLVTVSIVAVCALISALLLKIPLLKRLIL